MKNSTNNRPDPLSFRSSYKSVVINQLLIAPDKSNCVQDTGMNVIQLSDFSKLKMCYNTKRQGVDELDSVELNCSLEEYDSSQLNNVNYTAGWITAVLTHTVCLNRLKNDKQTSVSVSLLSTLRNSNNKNVSEQLSVFLSNVATLFNENFNKLLKESCIGVKQRLKQFVMESQPLDVVCDSCRDIICEKYLNMLVKGKIKSLNESLKKSRTKRPKTAGTEKAKKLNIG